MGASVPKGTPRTIVERLNTAFAAVFNEPNFIKFLDNQSVVSATTSPPDFIAFLKADRSAAESLIKIANTPRTEYKPE
jgi:tripartite-type tricarboxylate transporter receptor subunit TctC